MTGGGLARRAQDRSAAELDAIVADHLTVIEASRSSFRDLRPLADELCRRLDRGGVVYTFGNGGSAADAQHLAGELAGRFRRERGPIPAVALSTDPSVLTCIANDYGYEHVLARQVTALAGSDDALIVFSTSGRSPSVLRGLEAARGRAALTVLFTGEESNAAHRAVDHVIRVASADTQRIQETHVLMLHILSELIDRWAALVGR